MRIYEGYHIVTIVPMCNGRNAANSHFTPCVVHHEDVLHKAVGFKGERQIHGNSIVYIEAHVSVNDQLLRAMSEPRKGAKGEDGPHCKLYSPNATRTSEWCALAA